MERFDDDTEGPVSRGGAVRALVILGTIVGLMVLGGIFLGTEVSGVLSTVGASVGDPGGGMAYPPGDPDVADPPDGEPGADQGAGSGSGSGTGADLANAIDAARPDLLVIKNGTITLRAADIGRAIDAVTKRIVALGGYVSGSERSTAGEDARAAVTFRVPAARWEDALAAARGAGDDVIDEHSETEDVTGKVVDLRARVRNLQATEAALQAIMKRAGEIKDVLSVQAELTGVRGQIEELTAQADRLQEQAAYSTLSVVVELPPPPDASPTPAPTASARPAYDASAHVSAATDQLADNVETLTTAGIWFAIVWLPIFVGLGLALGLGYLGVRLVRRAVLGPAAAASAGEG